MPHIVYAGVRTAISSSQLADLKDKLTAAAAAGEPLEISLIDAEGSASWLFWTPGAPIVLNDADVPPVPEFPFFDLSSLGLPGFPEAPPQQQRRVGF